MADRIQPTPRNKLLGLLADALGGVYDYAQRPDPTMPMGLANPVLGLLADALPLRAGANVLDDLSYGQMPIRGTGMTTRLNPDATELAMAAAPFPKTSGKAALAAMGAVDAGAHIAPQSAMFIGASAKTWDKASNAAATAMEKAGADPQAIWRDTGNLRGVDGKWRQEISDNAAQLKRGAGSLYSSIKPGDTLGNIISHDDWFRAYPVDSMAVQRYAGLDSRYQPGYTKERADQLGNLLGEPIDPVLIEKLRMGIKSDQSDLLHEMQHIVQQREGFAVGGNPDLMRAEIDKASAAHTAAWNKFFDKAERKYGVDLFQDKQRAYETLQKDNPKWAREYFDLLTKEQNLGIDSIQNYRRLAGEAEARATQARMNMTPEQRRATFPYDSYDVPVNQLIVRSLLD